MKIFISHQRADSDLAMEIAGRLRSPHGIDVYLDVYDPDATTTGDALGDHIRTQLGLCQQLLAVVSARTAASWWVPWEIGIATEKERPIATYSRESTALPVYLKKWPYLSSIAALDKYAAVVKKTSETTELRKAYLAEANVRKDIVGDHYRRLRAALGQ